MSEGNLPFEVRNALPAHGLDFSKLIPQVGIKEESMSLEKMIIWQLQSRDNTGNPAYPSGELVKSCMSPDLYDAVLDKIRTNELLEAARGKGAGKDVIEPLNKKLEDATKRLGALDEKIREKFGVNVSPSEILEKSILELEKDGGKFVEGRNASQLNIAESMKSARGSAQII